MSKDGVSDASADFNAPKESAALAFAVFAYISALSFTETGGGFWLFAALGFAYAAYFQRIATATPATGEVTTTTITQGTAP